MDRKLIIRTVITIIAALNILLGYAGVKIPLSNGDAAAIVNAVIVLVTAVVWAWGYWKNNSFTLKAKLADIVLSDLNSGRELQIDYIDEPDEDLKDSSTSGVAQSDEDAEYTNEMLDLIEATNHE